MMSLRIQKVILSVCFLFACGNLFSQSTEWEAPLGGEGELSRAWQGDTKHYRVSAGSLHLDAPKGSLRSYITTATRLGESTSWQGLVQMKALPTAQNYTYILLAKIGEQDTERRYLALAFGGRDKYISLCEAFFVQSGGSYVHQPKRDVSLIHTSYLPKQLLTGLSYQVTLDKGESLLLYLSEDDIRKAELLESIELSSKVSLSGANEFGVYNAHTESKRQGISLSNLRITESVSSTTELEPVKPSEGDNKSRELSPALLLSEVMANPLAGSAEYIELYNNSDTPQYLADYSLALGANSESLRIYPMARLQKEIEARSYYILSSKPDAVKATYPSSARERMMQANMPQLRNAGFVLQLYYKDKKIDEVIYDPMSLPKGLRTKRGVSLERSTWANDSPWLLARRDAGYASPTLANTQEGRVATEHSDNVNEDKGELITKLIQRLEREEGSRAIIRVYDFLGQSLSLTPEERSLDKLREIQDNPYQGLKSLSAGARSAILVLCFTDKDGRMETYDLKFSLLSLAK